MGDVEGIGERGVRGRFKWRGREGEVGIEGRKMRMRMEDGLIDWMLDAGC